MAAGLPLPRRGQLRPVAAMIPVQDKPVNFNDPEKLEVLAKARQRGISVIAPLDPAIFR